MNTRACLSLIAAAVFVPSLSFAAPQSDDDRPDLIGEIQYEGADQAKRPDDISRDNGIEYYKNFAEAVEKLANKESAALGELDGNSIGYLGAVYLYCALKTGACPLVLDAVLEADIVRAKLGLSQGCPMMTKFWALYGRNSLEERHQYMVKTGHLMIVDRFNKEQRPRYIQCEPTVEKELSGPASPQEYFAARYAAGSEKRLLPAKMYSLLSGLKDKAPNAFVAVGARSSAGRASAQPAERKNSQSQTRSSSSSSRSSSSSKSSTGHRDTSLSSSGFGGGGKKK